MRMKLFRDKLSQEIKEAEALVKDGHALDQRIQAHVYCIAALSRKIMTRMDKAEKIKVKAQERSRRELRTSDNEVSLKCLNNKILHYFDFLPTDMANLGSRPLVRVLSDEDKDLPIREVNLRDFFEVTKRISDDAKSIVSRILRHAKKCLGKLNRTGEPSRLLEIEAMESLIDAFDIVRELKREKWIDGSITLFREEMNPSSFEVIGMRTAEIGCDTLFRKLFTVWHMPFSQFDVYAREDYGLKLHSKRVMRIESSANEDGLTAGSMIRLEDLINMLHIMEKKPFDDLVNHARSEQEVGRIVWGTHQ